MRIVIIHFGWNVLLTQYDHGVKHCNRVQRKLENNFFIFLPVAKIRVERNVQIRVLMFANKWMFLTIHNGQGLISKN